MKHSVDKLQYFTGAFSHTAAVDELPRKHFVRVISGCLTKAFLPERPLSIARMDENDAAASGLTVLLKTTNARSRPDETNIVRLDCAGTGAIHSKVSWS